MSANFDFDDNYWHDSILESIYINRTDPGHLDQVEIVVKWYDTKKRTKLIFDKVYLYKAKMNFGIIALESIDAAYVTPPDDPDIVGFYEKWKGFFNHVKINGYVIRTSSTGGEIKILATDVQMFDV